MILLFSVRFNTFSNNNAFYRASACTAQRDIAITFLSVRPMPWYSVETIAHIIRLFSLSGRAITLIFLTLHRVTKL